MRHGAPYDRTERVADAIRRLVAETMLTEISDPRLREIQITGVRVTKDLRIARIYYHFIDPTEEKRRLIADGFRSAAGYLRHRIGQELALKFTPEVEFFYDESVDMGEKIDELMARARGEAGNG